MLMNNIQELKDFLDEKVIQYNRKDFISSDPIQLIHQFDDSKDIEIMALLISTIAWGNRTSIINNGKRLIEIMQNEPYRFITETYESDWKNIQFIHRTFNRDDLFFFFLALQNIYKQFDSLEKVFQLKKGQTGVANRIANFRLSMFQTAHLKRSEKHISNPLSGSAAKRLNMFLRWMVRQDKNGVDFGIWKSIPMSELHIPLDVHTANVARKLGILVRKQNDWKALEEIQHTLIQLDAKDPAKYDFALFGLGVFEGF
jgi:uncharacterized protein (TIGR02757 family)